MNVWIIAPAPHQQRLLEPLKDPTWRVFCSETALGAFDAMHGRFGVDTFIVGGFDGAAAAGVVGSIRAHPTLWQASVLVVGEEHGAAETVVMRAVGADLCYSLPFVPAVYAGRVRAALELRRA